jgi:hypothetical protein
MRKTLLLFALLLTGASDPPLPAGTIRITPPVARLSALMPGRGALSPRAAASADR